jgi:hypothetical protein
MSKTTTKSKEKGKGKGTKLEMVVARTDDNFDDMLAELRAEDVPTDVATSTNRSASSSNRSSTSTPSFRATAAAVEVSEEALMQACVRGDLSQLRCWARRGVRVTSAEPLCHAVWYGEYEVVQCLVGELGADVNQAGDNGITAMYNAALLVNLGMVKC